ncbi:MAG: DUF4845 domain-containing protein [Gammaproteobacteria bacterium]|nr:DUF4845 domain-containing protein [Gammaproteobacteria bacterium]
MINRRQQRGMTFLGYIIVLSIIGFFALLVLKLVPIYLEHQSVVKALRSVADQPATSSPASVRSTIQKNLDIDNVSVVKAKDFKIRRASGVSEVYIEYEAETNFAGNVYILVKFSESVEMGGV